MLIEPPLTTDQIHEIILEICESQETNLAYSHHIKNLTRHITFREKELNQAKAETRLYKDRTSFELVSDLQQLTQQLATAKAESKSNWEIAQSQSVEKEQIKQQLAATRQGIADLIVVFQKRAEGWAKQGTEKGNFVSNEYLGIISDIQHSFDLSGTVQKENV